VITPHTDSDYIIKKNPTDPNRSCLNLTSSCWPLTHQYTDIHKMAMHTHSDNDAASKTDASSSDNLQWVYNEESQAILHKDGCEECDNWKEHYKFSQDIGHPSMLKAH
jgi:hypothetical protein